MSHCEDKRYLEIRDRVRSAIGEDWISQRELSVKTGISKASVRRHTRDLEVMLEITTRFSKNEIGREELQYMRPPPGYIPPLFPEAKEDARALAACFNGYTYYTRTPECRA